MKPIDILAIAKGKALASDKKGSDESFESEDTSMDYEALAGDIMDAAKADDKAAFAEALRAFIDACKFMGEEPEE